MNTPEKIKKRAYYAIRNIKTGQYISGTDKKHRPARQIPADEYRAPLLFTGSRLLAEIRTREINPELLEVKA